MRLLLPALIVVLICGCGKETHVRNKVNSILPQIQQDMLDGEVEQAFAPEMLNPWVHALGTPKVVDRLQIALEEMPQYRRASLWMLKAYAPAETWQAVAARYPDLSAGLPGVAGYGEHPRMAQPNDAHLNDGPATSVENSDGSGGGRHR
jgi:hypothetical protein